MSTPFTVIQRMTTAVRSPANEKVTCPLCRHVAVGGDSSGSLFKAFFYQGIHHIFTGYDHLLFISALVLAATTFCDLIKVATAFTIAHTITLSLAAITSFLRPRG
jgi:hydrogenase/urease accessory protein HupE